jgi:cell division protein FtsL
MTRRNLLLLAALIGSCLWLVHVSYQSRRLFAELERERAAARQLASDFERLQVDRRAQATHLRVEKLAREQLQMRSATPGVTQYVVDARGPQLPPATRTAAAGAAAAEPVQRRGQR